MFLIRRRKRFQFTERKHSKKGIAVSILSMAELVAYGVIVTQAFRTDGGLSAYYGSAGICLLIFSVVLVVLAAQSMMEEDSYPLFPRLSLALSILVAFCWGATYALGLGLIG